MLRVKSNPICWAVDTGKLHCWEGRCKEVVEFPCPRAIQARLDSSRRQLPLCGMPPPDLNNHGNQMYSPSNTLL